MVKVVSKFQFASIRVEATDTEKRYWNIISTYETVVPFVNNADLSADGHEMGE